MGFDRPKDIEAIFHVKVEKLTYPDGGLCIVYGLYPSDADAGLSSLLMQWWENNP